MPEGRITSAERAIQNHVLRLICEQLTNYTYIGNLRDVENSNIREEVLMKWLCSSDRGEAKLSHDQAQEALRKLKTGVKSCSTFDTLMQTSEEIYDMLRFGTSISQGIGQQHKAVHFIDWKHPEKNIFEVAEEVTVKSDGVGMYDHVRPDIVVYVNGIALCVIELKRSGVPVTEAIRQNYRNQQNGYIPQFFTTVQLTMAGNPSEGLWYGTTCTPEKFYLHWKETTGKSYDPALDEQAFKDVVNELDRSLLQLLEPTRLLSFIHDYVV